ncbi:MAG: flagellar protein FlgN [Candidatus Brocadiaceae bacterium]|nr:flagellar protein FlgN [Candidatus Brocadiaceae bacterium]
MVKLLDDLIETIERMSVVYNELVDVARIKKTCLIKGSIEELERLIFREKNQTEMAQLLEEKRRNIIQCYCNEQDVQEKNITMENLLNGMDKETRKKVQEKIVALKASLRQLKELNEANATLTNYSLDITTDIMKMFFPPMQQNSIYAQTGKMQGYELSRVLVDTKI